MFMLFKFYKSMAEVGVASQEFLTAIQIYLSRYLENRKVHLKVIKTYKPVALRIGPIFVQPGTVGNCMMVLMNYYIMAALWK